MASRTKHPGPVAEGTSSAVPAKEMETRIIPWSLIHPDPAQPREKADKDLADDLRVRGQLDPITVRRHPDLLTEEWMIVNGERRWRSAEGVLWSMRCQIDESDSTPASRLANQLAHNTGKPLTPFEEARAFRKIMDDTGMSVADVADFLGRAKSTVAERVGLFELGPWLPLIEAGDVVLSHAIKVLFPLRAIADELHAQAIEKVVEEGFARKPGPHDDEILVDDFRDAVMTAYKPFFYPLTPSKAYGAKNPEFATAKHLTECGCGGFKLRLHSHEQERMYCGNPEWWKPLHAAAVKAKKEKEKKANAGNDKSSPKGKTLYLPASVPTIKSDYGRATKGIVQLTDSMGNWSPKADHQALPFDPADLAIDDTKLVQWKYGGDYPCIGTKDAAAVKKARAVWISRFADSYAEHIETLKLAIKQNRKEAAVSGAGCVNLMQLMVFDDGSVSVLDVAKALGFKLPSNAADEKLQPWQREEAVEKWAKTLDAAHSAELLTGIAVCLRKKLTMPSARVDQMEDSAIANIRKREIPWKKAPKPEKTAPAAKKPVPAKLAKKGATAKKATKKAATIPLARLSEDTAELPFTKPRSQHMSGAACVLCDCTGDRACAGGCSWLLTRNIIGKEVGVCSTCATDSDEAEEILDIYLDAQGGTKKHRATPAVMESSRKRLIDMRADRAAESDVMRAPLADEDDDEEDGAWSTHKDDSDDLCDSTAEDVDDEEMEPVV